MQKKAFIGAFLLLAQLGYAQSKKEITNMEKSQFLGLRTTIYKVGNITEARECYSQEFGIEPYFDESFYVGFI